MLREHFLFNFHNQGVIGNLFVSIISINRPHTFFVTITLFVTPCTCLFYLLSDETSFSVSLLDDCANDRSINIFLHISRKAFAIVLAATSHLKTIKDDQIENW